MSALGGASRGGDGGGLRVQSRVFLVPADDVRSLLRPYPDESGNAAGPPPLLLALDAGTNPPPLEGLMAHDKMLQAHRQRPAGSVVCIVLSLCRTSDATGRRGPAAKRHMDFHPRPPLSKTFFGLSCELRNQECELSVIFDVSPKHFSSLPHGLLMGDVNQVEREVEHLRVVITRLGSVQPEGKRKTPPPVFKPKRQSCTFSCPILRSYDA